MCPEFVAELHIVKYNVLLLHALLLHWGTQDVVGSKCNHSTNSTEVDVRSDRLLYSLEVTVLALSCSLAWPLLWEEQITLDRAGVACDWRF